VFQSAPVSNDGCAGAISIENVPYTNTQATTGATGDAGDPSPICGNGSRSDSVWYRFVAPGNGTVTADTLGSDYDTLLSSYSGSCGYLAAVAGGCNDDAPSGGVTQSQVSFPVTAGSTTYFMVSSRTAGGGSLVFHLGYAQSGGAGATRFYPVAPCRLFDTRNDGGADAAAPGLGAGETRKLTVGARCSLPAAARSLSVNVTVTGQTAAGELLLFRGDLTLAPAASSISFRPGVTRGNNAIVELARDGSGTFKVLGATAGTVHLIVDVNGYFQ